MVRLRLLSFPAFDLLARTLYVEMAAHGVSMRPHAKELAASVYKMFGEDDFEGIDKACAIDCAFTWSGPDGKVESYGWLGKGSQMENVVSKLPDSYPGFTLTPVCYIAEGNQCFIQLRATTDGGMDAIFGHHIEFNDEGKMIRWVEFNDISAMAKYRQTRDRVLPRDDASPLLPPPASAPSNVERDGTNIVSRHEMVVTKGARDGKVWRAEVRGDGGKTTCLSELAAQLDASATRRLHHGGKAQRRRQKGARWES